jgi:hypothetical protein
MWPATGTASPSVRGAAFAGHMRKDCHVPTTGLRASREPLNRRCFRIPTRCDAGLIIFGRGGVTLADLPLGRCTMCAPRLRSVRFEGN